MAKYINPSDLSSEQRAIYEENLIQLLGDEKCFGNGS
jgi:hypothetical protein